MRPDFGIFQFMRVEVAGFGTLFKNARNALFQAEWTEQPAPTGSRFLIGEELETRFVLCYFTQEQCPTDGYDGTLTYHGLVVRLPPSVAEEFFKIAVDVMETLK